MAVVRVHVEGGVAVVDATGATLASAVGRAARKLLGIGVSNGRIARVDSHTVTWGYRYQRRDYVLVVRESRSGASGEGGNAQVMLRLAPRDHAALDNLAIARGLTRSALVAALVREATR